MTAITCEPETETADRADRALSVKLVTGAQIPDELIARSSALAPTTPFGRVAWWSAWWRHLRPRNSELFLLTVWQGDELVGLAPWYTRRTLSQGRVVRFLGDGSACSDYLSIGAAAGYHDRVWREIAGWIIAEKGQSWNSFILSGVSAADEPFQSFCQQLSNAGVFVDQRPIANTWRMELPDTFEGYLDRLSKQQRNRSRRAARDFFDSGRAVLRHVTDLDEFERGFEIERHMHQARRNSLGDAGCFADARFTSFLSEALRRLLAEDALRLCWTEVDGSPVAFDCGLIGQKSVYVYQTAFDPTYAELSPGKLHLQASIKQAIEHGYRYFDFLRGDEAYKANLRATPIPILETRLVSPRCLPMARHRLWRLERRIKDKIRAVSAARAASSKDVETPAESP